MKESVKKIVRERAKFCCEYCLAQSQFSADIFSIEHIIPISKGGTSVISNLAYSCQCCNNHKFTATHVIDPATGHIISLINLRQLLFQVNKHPPY